jgi:malate dehydrogenase (oxaloacetate-decarboxylating)(NADP+)
MTLKFGPDYLIPKPFDPRLIAHVAPAVAQAAMDSGVARRPIVDMAAYRERLQSRVYRTGMTMKPVFERAREAPKRVVYAEGEDDKVLEVARQAIEEGIARPVLVGRTAVIEEGLAALGIDLMRGRHFDLIDPQDNPRYAAYCDAFHRRVQRKGYSPREACETLRNNPTVLAATLLVEGDADAMICGTVGRYRQHLAYIQDIVGLANGVTKLTAMNALVLDSGTLFMADTYVQEDPSAEDLAEIVRLCAEEVRWFGLEPKAALLSHSNFGSHDTASARKMRAALDLIHRTQPELEVEGEMHADHALSEELRRARFPQSRLGGKANLLVMPNQDAANIAFNLLKQIGEGIAIGPVLVGAAKSAHVVTPSITVRGLLNMTALAAVRAG